MKKKTVKAVEPAKKDEILAENQSAMPLMASFGSDSSPVRRNRAATIERSDAYANIESAVTPFTRTQSGNYSVKNLVELCQKAYYSVSIFKNAVELLTDFSCSKLFFTGGSKQTREFFEAYLTKIGIYKLMPQFFREHYRSCNTFIFRYDGDIKKEDLAKITQTYGGIKKSDSVTLPIGFTILNTGDIETQQGATYGNDYFYKVISDYQLARLRHPRNPEDIELFNSLPKEIQNQIKSGSTYVLMPLDPEKVTYIANQKQPYEPLAVPMFYPVLQDLNAKIEMKKMDAAVSRTMQQVVLLITMGSEKGGVNTRALETMQGLFQNESVGRVLVSDFTTSAKFIIPDVASFLSPEKYIVLNADIAESMNTILMSSGTGGEKFANGSMKLQVFVERLKSGRDTFLNEFLIPEIKRISKTLGFKSYPTPKFEEINLKDELEFAKLYSRLWETGLLTADETLDAIESGRLPTASESKESQVEFKALKDKGFYPLQMAPPKDPAAGAGGRPTGPGPKIPNKKVKPIGGSRSDLSYGFSLKSIQANIILSQEVQDKVEKALKKNHKLKKLGQEELLIAENITNVIISNEEKENWLKADIINAYIEKPIDTNQERVREIQEIAVAHNVNDYLASILYVSKTELPEESE